MVVGVGVELGVGVGMGTDVGVGVGADVGVGVGTDVGVGVGTDVGVGVGTDVDAGVGVGVSTVVRVAVGEAPVSSQAANSNAVVTTIEINSQIVAFRMVAKKLAACDWKDSPPGRTRPACWGWSRRPVPC